MVPLPVTGRVDRCWDVVPACRVSTVIRALMVLLLAAGVFWRAWRGVRVRLFTGDDWAEDHHDIEVMDEAGKVLARRRLPEGMAGMSQLHALLGGLLGDDDDEAEGLVGIETDPGPREVGKAAAGDIPDAAAVKVLAPIHKTMIWDPPREVQRLRHQLLQSFPAALEAFG